MSFNWSEMCRTDKAGSRKQKKKVITPPEIKSNVQGTLVDGNMWVMIGDTVISKEHGKGILREITGDVGSRDCEVRFYEGQAGIRIIKVKASSLTKEVRLVGSTYTCHDAYDEEL